MNKTKLVKKWLLKKKSITTFQAFELFGATRLSAIIYSLRKSGMPIKAESVKIKDRYGHTCIIAKYKLKGVKK
ncbi:MAG TPA: helix-turn-helix domain-containing protein [Anaerohalosphaeraceae bacterium]|nr:helix-turn-helix domain-containing protein [Anaerohalosphaeraceae bacterium]